MINKISLSLAFTSLTILSSLNADTLIHIADNKRVTVNGEIENENNQSVSIKIDGQEKITKLKAANVLSITRSKFPDSLIEAHALSLSATWNNDKITKAVDALDKVRSSDNKDIPKWVKEYAARYKIDLFYSIGNLAETSKAVEEFADIFSDSRQLLHYYKKVAHLAINANDSKKIREITTHLTSLDAKLGSILSFYLDCQLKLKNNDYIEAEKKLKTLINKHIPNLGKEQTLEIQDLYLNSVESYGFSLLSLKKTDEAKKQLDILKKHISEADDRVTGLYLSLSADFSKANGDHKAAYHNYMKLVVQFPHQKDLQARALVNAIEMTKELKLDKVVPILTKQLKMTHQSYKQIKLK